ncbi:hypothetical protein MFIFM68171_03452 [Madurella fahalii]|uniref:Uncharacterized protein n=1 Tax=Madurella fahalii TaxID=1157608 RepID=A0ABQ0G655_9PEZI
MHLSESTAQGITTITTTTSATNSAPNKPTRAVIPPPYTAEEAASFARQGASIIALPPGEVGSVAWNDLLKEVGEKRTTEAGAGT